MKIDDIRPYERNARNNEKAIPVVAESIREFGLKGQIVLESPDNPVIVAGHTRWAACKMLGWTEIPDERIDYCTDMTEEQIKAFRLADNRTGEVATWNRSLLQSEMKQIGKLDMGKFKFDFKSKTLDRGAERLRTDDYYNLGMVNVSHCDDEGMPRMRPCDEVPTGLLPFNYAKTAKPEDKAKFLHFFKDDYQFERLWNRPEAYLELVRSFAGALSPDFSCYMDMPLPMVRWNEYRRRALGNYWQRNGVEVIPTLSWSTPKTYSFCFEGLPKGSTVAVSTVGVANDEVATKVFFDGMKAAMRMLSPSRVVQYGSDVGFDYGGAEVVTFKNNSGWS